MPQINVVDLEGASVGSYEPANGTIETMNGTWNVDNGGMVTDSEGNYVGQMHNGKLDY